MSIAIWSYVLSHDLFLIIACCEWPWKAQFWAYVFDIYEIVSSSFKELFINFTNLLPCVFSISTYEQSKQCDIFTGEWMATQCRKRQIFTVAWLYNWQKIRRISDWSMVYILKVSFKLVTKSSLSHNLNLLPKRLHKQKALAHSVMKIANILWDASQVMEFCSYVPVKSKLKHLPPWQTLGIRCLLLPGREGIWWP